LYKVRKYICQEIVVKGECFKVDSVKSRKHEIVRILRPRSINIYTFKTWEPIL